MKTFDPLTATDADVHEINCDSLTGTLGIRWRTRSMDACALGREDARAAAATAARGEALNETYRAFWAQRGAARAI